MMEALNKILQIPERCLVNKKITKAFFKRNFDLTSSEKALLDDASVIVSINWLASISLTSANIPEYKDDAQLFEEVQVITVEIAGQSLQKNHARIVDLIQKYIPYPVLLCIQHSDWFSLNACDKTINQNDSSRRVIDRKYDTSPIDYLQATPLEQQFIDSIAFASLDKTNLKNYYDSYIQRIVALHTAGLIGVYSLRSKERTLSDSGTLEKIEVLQKEIQLLQNQAKAESQLNQQVALNTLIHEKRNQIDQLKALITE